MSEQQRTEEIDEIGQQEAHEIHRLSGGLNAINPPPERKDILRATDVLSNETLQTAGKEATEPRGSAKWEKLSMPLAEDERELIAQTVSGAKTVSGQEKAEGKQMREGGKSQQGKE